MIDFMNFWVNELWGSPLLAIIGIELVYAVIMFLGRFSTVLMFPLLMISFIVFSGLLWGALWVTFMLAFSLIYFVFSLIKVIPPA